MRSASISAPPIYIPVQRIASVTPDSPIYGTGTTGAFMAFGDAWIEDMILDEGPTSLDLSPFDEIHAFAELDDDGTPYTDVDPVAEIIESDVIEMMDEIDAALDALCAALDDPIDDHRMYLVDRDGNRTYFDSGTALHAAVRSQPRRSH